MRSLAVRVVVLVLFVAAAGVSAYLFWAGEIAARAQQEAGARFDARAASAVRDALELRAAQQGYVAIGQGEQFWISKVTSATPALVDVLAVLKTEAASPEAESAIGSAAESLDDFAQMDRRAREHTQAGQKLLASDLVFSSGLETTGSVVSFIDKARAAEARVRDEAIQALRRRQLFALGAAAAAALLALLLLVPRPQDAEPAALALAEPLAARAGTELRLTPDEGWTPARKAAELAQAAAAAQPTPPAVVAPAGPTIDLASVAAVCTDLARIETTESLPSILARAADALDASGIVLWISESDGKELAPVLAHGYPQQVVARLARIPREAENATAAAFRTALLQTVKTDVMSDGAIAAPLLTHAGCVGVMAAEVRSEGERDPGKLAAAAIVAAQISTLVAPPAARAQAAEAAGA